MMSLNQDLIKLPPRWLKCPRRGQLVAGKFVPFKTPLDDRYQSLIPPQDLFTPQMFISMIASYKMKMGLWVDLTFTTRFYDKSIVENASICYIKYNCRGHDECPTKDQVAAFIDLCDRFLKKNPDNSIGVHCTHGFNRTGFLICAFLIEKFEWSVEMAIAEFAKMRPPGIYKQDYINELFRRYQDIADATAAPPLPDWCNEFEDNDDEGNPIKGPRQARNGVKSKAIEGVSGVDMIDDLTAREVQRRCQEMCNWNKPGFPGLQPVSMDRQNITKLHNKPYKVSWKADGTRFMMLVDGKDKHYFIDRDNCVFKIHGISFFKRNKQDSQKMEHLENTLLDGELVIQTLENGEKSPRYLIYDIVMFDGQNVGGTEFNIRLACIQKEIVGPREEAKRIGLIDRSQEPFSIRQKDFWDLSPKYINTLLSKEFGKNLCHEVDGLIFQPVPDPYSPGQCDSVLKWKPPTLNSVDFKLKITIDDRPGMLRTKIGNLLVGGNQLFSTIKVTKDLVQYDNKIIECTFDLETKQWRFLRERTDKSFPNSFNTAKSVCDSILNPVTEEGLLDYIERHRWVPKPPPPPPGSKKRPAPGSDDSVLMPPPKIPKS